MKSLLTTATFLAVAVVTTLAEPLKPARAAILADEGLIFSKHETRADTCTIANDNLCPACDSEKIPFGDGNEYVVSCDWQLLTASEEEVDGKTSTKICLEACNEAEKCLGVNIASNGSCVIVTGDKVGMSRASGVANLLLVSDATTPSASTSQLLITSTISVAGVIQTAKSATTTIKQTTLISTSSSSTKVKTSIAEATPTGANDQCDLTLTNLCPACDGRQVQSEDGNAYTLLCDNDLWSNGSYSPQDWMSPGECLNECDDLDFCKGTMYYDDRNCELAKGEDVFPTSRAGYTAFLPVGTVTASTARVQSTPSAFRAAGGVTATLAGRNETTTASAADATLSILPFASGCDSNAPSCPACNGLPYLDQLNSSYTILCGIEPSCESKAQFSDGAEDMEQCLQSCDQDATCLAAMYYPDSSACQLCQQGMNTKEVPDLPYILLAADIDGDNDEDETATMTLKKPSTSIVDVPAPFTDISSVNAVGPVGPVLVSSFPTATASRVANPGGPITTASSTAIHLTMTAAPTATANIDDLTCPDLHNDIYVEPGSGNYFEVNCNNIFGAARSHYTSASDFADCVAVCTGECDGVQFGYSTRCGLYTDISVLQSATGWTVAASITYPTPLSASTAGPTFATLAPYANETRQRS